MGWLTCLHRSFAADRRDGQAARRMEVDGRLTSTVYAETKNN
jgi:hypothetical protein